MNLHLSAELVVRAREMALLTLLAIFIGEPLARYSGLDRLALKTHSAIEWLGRKLNRPNRSVAKRVYRGIIALTMVELPAVFFGALFSDPLPSWRIVNALIVVALVGRGYCSWSLANRRAEAKTGTLLLEADGTLHADTHGVLRQTILTNAESFAMRVIGGGFWYVAGGLAAMFAYLTLAIFAAHFSPRREQDLAFGWAANLLDRVADAPPRFLAGFVLLVGALAVPKTRSLAALKSLFAKNRSWYGMVATLLDISLGGPTADGELPWRGPGTAQLTAEHLTRWIAVLSAASLLWILLLLALSLT